MLWTVDTSAIAAQLYADGRLAVKQTFLIRAIDIDNLYPGGHALGR